MQRTSVDSTSPSVSSVLTTVKTKTASLLSSSVKVNSPSLLHQGRPQQCSRSRLQEVLVVVPQYLSFNALIFLLFGQSSGYLLHFRHLNASYLELGSRFTSLPSFKSLIGSQSMNAWKRKFWILLLNTRTVYAHQSYAINSSCAPFVFDSKKKTNFSIYENTEHFHK